MTDKDMKAKAERLATKARQVRQIAQAVAEALDGEDVPAQALQGFAVLVDALLAQVER
jgi:hypothetical protein